MEFDRKVLNLQHPDWIAAFVSLLAAKELAAKRQQVRAIYSPELSYGRHFSPPGPTARQAAVMVLLNSPTPNSHWSDCTIPLTVRPQHLPDHPGQISFPGGRVEEGELIQRAAVREFEEELGVAFQGQIIGQLSPVWVFNSDYALTPYLAVLVGELAVCPCDYEVERVIHYPVSRLLLDADNDWDDFARGSVRWRANVFRAGDDRVWGVTAVVLAELAVILRQLKKLELNLCEPSST